MVFLINMLFKSTIISCMWSSQSSTIFPEINKKKNIFLKMYTFWIRGGEEVNDFFFFKWHIKNIFHFQIGLVRFFYIHTATEVREKIISVDVTLNTYQVSMLKDLYILNWIFFQELCALWRDFLLSIFWFSSLQYTISVLLMPDHIPRH